MGAAPGLRVELDGKGPELRVVQSLAGSVVGVDKGDAAPFHGAGVHGIAVVLAGDIGPGAAQVPDGLVDPPVAVFQLIGSAPRRQGGELVPQAGTARAVS